MLRVEGNGLAPSGCGTTPEFYAERTAAVFAAVDAIDPAAPKGH